ncbi:tetratricopeptide repeat protein [Luteimonas yindakuii]|uniref:Tetratricopeptide repeat protein n=2 Tax=Luteimonas yindakuii TaxID=2565782 RepID=A0A4Z1R939_9GAMM|nr:tetratricopeptide repeat protein [Luteimonas yindakuii]
MAGPAVWPKSADLRPMYDSILDALRRGAPGEALAAARDLTTTRPDDGRAWELMAQAQRMGGDANGALDSLDHAIALQPDEAALQFQRAAILLARRDIDAATTALTRTLELDPNRYQAYIVQAELAIGRGDLDEAERLEKMAARLGEGDPGLSAVRGMIALRRGDRDRALSILSSAVERHADDPQLLNALAFAYIAKDHLAFAEQTLLRLVQLVPGNTPARRLLADVVLRQGRPAEAATHIEQVLAAGPASTEHLRFAGALDLQLGQLPQAVARLKQVLARTPDDRTALDLLMRAWELRDDRDDARATLEAALATSPRNPALWDARLGVDGSDPDAALAVVERWNAAMPDSVPAVQARVSVAQAAGDQPAAEAAARELTRRLPGDARAQTLLLDLLTERDPQAAVAHLQELHAAAGDDAARRSQVEGWLALAHDQAGNVAEAAKVWIDTHASWAERLMPLPTWSQADVAHAPAAQPDPDAARLVFMAGLPGAGHEQVGRLLTGVVSAFRADRLGTSPPRDALQNVHTVGRLERGETTPADVHAEWRAQLPARGIAQGALIDWLLWWDNAYLAVTRAHLPHAELLMIVRDPRDMLLNWLAFGSPVPFRMGTPDAGAAWLAQGLEHLVVLAEQEPQPLRLLRTDEGINDAALLGQALGQALEVELPAPPRTLFQDQFRFPAGHWRRYTGVLAAPFAALTPVAVRLGYSET